MFYIIVLFMPDITNYHYKDDYLKFSLTLIDYQKTIKLHYVVCDGVLAEDKWKWTN